MPGEDPTAQPAERPAAQPPEFPGVQDLWLWLLVPFGFVVSGILGAGKLREARTLGYRAGWGDRVGGKYLAPLWTSLALVVFIVGVALVLPLAGLLALGLYANSHSATPVAGQPPAVVRPDGSGGHVNDEGSAAAPSPADPGQIDGLMNYRRGPSDPGRSHRTGRLDYPQSPPVGGDHNPRWQNCEGNVYDEPIANEHAVHSLEHGAVWVTYRPDLPSAEIDLLRKRVEGTNYMLMSPYPGLDVPISLQAWGVQLKLDAASDSRIDVFISTFRQVASQEAGATCGSGVTATGTEPQPG